jgi:uncharacterized protein (TIGR01244 family)
MLFKLSLKKRQEIIKMTNTLLLLSLLTFATLANTELTSKAMGTPLIEQLSLKNAKSFSSMIITGGQPVVADLTLLAQKGMKKVINLRPIDEFSAFDEKNTVESLAMEYIHIPVKGAQGINKANLALFSKALAVNEDQKTFVHCASGNRAGALFALHAYFNQKQSLESAIEIGHKAGMTSLEKRVRALIAKEK